MPIPPEDFVGPKRPRGRPKRVFKPPKLQEAIQAAEQRREYAPDTADTLVEEVPTDFNPDIASKILERVAMGETLKEVARDPKMPTLLKMYGWLRENYKIDGEKFVTAYHRAQDDRAQTWADDAAIAYKDFMTSTEEIDPQKVRLAGDHARMLISLMKENRSQKRQITLQGSKDAPTVIIETFANPGDDLDDIPM